jgi:T4 RnlA family RNA ligase
MNTNLDTLFDDLTALCEQTEAFYSVDQTDANGTLYRVFTYRLASYSDFQYRNANECRGHTFRKDRDTWVLASLPMQKFFNLGEHVGWGTELDLSTITAVMDKADGSLISTVVDANGFMFLKSKTSFKSQQAVDADRWMRDPDNFGFLLATQEAVELHGCTVNFEWVSPENQIVIGYAQPRLIVLNARNMSTGEYVPHDTLVERYGARNVIASHDLPADPAQFLIDAEKITGIEGFIICFENGLWVKLKTEAYCVLHHLKDSINNSRRLWEACIAETADDLRALFHADPLSMARVCDMEEKVSKIYNSIHVSVHAFYNENKGLDRKDYAIKGQVELGSSGLFSLAMNLYLGKECGIKKFMVKNFKSYGVKDEDDISE